jgi:hypothetical protein
VNLAKATDLLDDRYGLGEALGGMILLSVAGSLPELAITISAAVAGNLGMAAGNLIGRWPCRRWCWSSPTASSGGTGRCRPRLGHWSPRSRGGGGRPILLFAVASIVTLIAGMLLERSGNQLADNWGMNGVVFGAMFLAAATALPEISTGVTGVREGGLGGGAPGPSSCTLTRGCATKRCVTGWGEGTHRWAVAAARLKLRAALAGRRQAGWEQP